MSFSYASCLPRVLGLGDHSLRWLELRPHTVELQTKCCEIGAISMKHSNKTGEFSFRSPAKCMNSVQQRLELCCSQFHWEDLSINVASCVQWGTWGTSLSRSSLTPKVSFQECLIFSVAVGSNTQEGHTVRLASTMRPRLCFWSAACSYVGL